MTTETTETEKKLPEPEIPQFSAGLDPSSNKLVIKIDSGRFMDSTYSYENIELDDDKNLNYNIMIRSLTHSGIELPPAEYNSDKAKELLNVEALLILQEITNQTKMMTESANDDIK